MFSLLKQQRLFSSLIRTGEGEFQGEDTLRVVTGPHPKNRLRDHRHDGIDAEVIFPNKGLSMIEETGMPITFHVFTGRDPRVSRGD